MKTMIRALAAVLTAVLLCCNLYYELAPGCIVGPEGKLLFAVGFAVLLGAALFYGVPPAARLCAAAVCLLPVGAGQRIVF